MSISLLPMHAVRPPATADRVVVSTWLGLGVRSGLGLGLGVRSGLGLGPGLGPGLGLGSGLGLGFGSGLGLGLALGVGLRLGLERLGEHGACCDSRHVRGRYPEGRAWVKAVPG